MFFGSETCTQVISLLVEIFGPDPDPNDIRGIAIDRACDVAPYCERLGKEGNHLESDVCHGVSGEAEELTEQMSLEVELREQAHRHLAHLQEQHSGVTAPASGELSFDPLNDADPAIKLVSVETTLPLPLPPVLLLHGEPQDDQESPHRRHSAIHPDMKPRR